MNNQTKQFLVKLTIVVLVICTLSACLIACGKKEKEATKEEPDYKEMLQGTWIWKEYEDNPIYMYLKFSGEKVKYGTNMFGEDLEKATWMCSYSLDMDAGKLVLTTEDGTDFTFTVKGNETKIRIYNDKGNEYKKQK